MAVLNVFLLAFVFIQVRLLRQPRTPQEVSLAPAVAPRIPVKSSSGAGSRRPATPAPVAAAPVFPPAFPADRKVVDWRQVESDDYRTYVNNLRAIGCPEQTVRDVVISDLQKSFFDRRRQLLASQVPTNFWQGADSAVMQREKRGLDEEFGDVLKTLLGPDVVPPAGNMEWKLAEMDLRLGFLPDDKRDQTREVLLRYGELDEQIKSLSDGNLPTRDQEKLGQLLEDYDLKHKQLGGMLTPEQYEQVDMTVSWTAENLRRAMENFHPTEEEFRLIFREWRQHDEHLAQLYATGQPDPGNAQVFENISKFMSKERYQQYVQTWWK